MQRQVALKAVLPNHAQGTIADTSRQRFLREAQLAAGVKSDYIVTIYQVGEERGVPFLAMELLEGLALDDWLKGGRQPTVSQVLRLGREIALGLAAAHERRLIHRDIKPGNLWLDSGNGGRVKVLDFGLARALSGDVQLTQSGAIVGTPAYMAPEQARSEKVDGRADLFSLGVVLYRLTTGQLPFQGHDLMSTLMAIATDTPQPVRTLNPAVPEPLALLIMRLLEKDPTKRPASAKAVAVELQNLARSPQPDPLATPLPLAVVATPTVAQPAVPNATPRPVPVRRRGWLVAAVLLVLLGPLVYFAPTLLRFASNQGVLVIETDGAELEVRVKDGTGTIHDATAQREITVAAGAGAIEVRVRDAGGEMRFLTQEYRVRRGGKEIIRVRQELAQAAPKDTAPPRPATDTAPPKPRAPPVLPQSAALDPAKIPADERFPWQPQELLAVLGTHRQQHWDQVRSVVYHPAGKWVATASGTSESRICLWEPQTLRLLTEIDTEKQGIMGLALSADGKTLAAAYYLSHVQLWDVSGERPIPGTKIHGNLNYLAMRPDGKLLVGGNSHGLRLIDLTGLEPKVMPLQQAPEGKGFTHPTFTGDGQILAAGHFGGQVSLWDVSGPRPRALPPIETKQQQCRVYSSPLGRVLAIAGSNLKLVDLGGAERREVEVSGSGQVSNVGFSADGKTIAASAGSTFRVWDLDGLAAKQRPEVKGSPDGGIFSLSLSPDGKRLVLGTGWRTVRGWDVSGNKAVESLAWEGPQGQTYHVAFSRDGTRLATHTGVLETAQVQIWDANAGSMKVFATLSLNILGSPNRVDLSPDGKRLVTLENLNKVTLWDLTRSPPDDMNVLLESSELSWVRVAPDGKRVAAMRDGKPREILLWDISGDRFVLKGKMPWAMDRGGRSPTFSPDGKWLAVSDKTDSVHLLDVTGDAPRPHKVIPAFSVGMTFSPDSSLLATGEWMSKAKLWDLRGADPHNRIEMEAYQRCLAFTPDGQTLITAGEMRIRFWDVPTAAQAAKLQLRRETPKPWHEWRLPGPVESLTVAPQGDRVVTGNGNGTTYILRMPTRPAARP